MGKCPVVPPAGGSEKPFVCGTYTGDGTPERVIELGFTPSAVFVTTANGLMGDVHSKGGLALQDAPVRAGASNLYPIVEIVDGGFKVFYNNKTPFNQYTNDSASAYNPFHYIAFR